VPPTPSEPPLEQEVIDLRDKAEDMRRLLDTALLLDQEADVDRLASAAAESSKNSPG